jgi:2,4-diaminopentanoate dehydrogenase
MPARRAAKQIRLVQIGLGPLGQRIVQSLHARQIFRIVAWGLPVVSTCEELSYPWEAAAGLAGRIDRAARNAGVGVLATGVNPGFLMDSLPLALTAGCQAVESIRVMRIQDASTRRVPFQRKIGAGFTLEVFEAMTAEETLRHVGLGQSMAMIAERMGWNTDRMEDVLTPIVAEQRIETEAMPIEPGTAAGAQQIGRAFSRGKERMTLVFRAAIGEPDPGDTVEITGTPNIRSTVEGGVNGDVATCAITLNAIPRLLAAGPGLHTMTDIPLVSCFA